MEKLDYTLETIIENVLKSTELTIDAKKILFHELLQFIVDAIKILHNHGITHGDSHLLNFMYNKNLEKWQIIDFGLATDDIHDKNEDFEQLLDSFHRKIGFVMFKDIWLQYSNFLHMFFDKFLNLVHLLAEYVSK